MKSCLRPLRIAAALCAMLCLTGCWDKCELNELAIVLGVGIDRAADSPRDVSVTVQIAKSTPSMSPPSSGSGGGTPGGEAYFDIGATGQNVSTVLTNLSRAISRKIYTTQNQIIIFGSDLAKEGIRDSMDYVLRNYQGRLTVEVYVAKGKAKDILNIDPLLGKVPAVEIHELGENQSSTSETAVVTVADLMTDLISPTKSMVIPYLETGSENGKAYIKMSDSAVFKGDRAVGELNEKETRGYLWVIDKIHNGKITVDAKGEQAVLDVTRSKTNVEPLIRADGSVTIKVNVREEGTLSSQTGALALYTQKNTQMLESETARAIQSEIQLALTKSFQLGTDIFGFGDMLNKRYPERWKSMESGWDRLYRRLDVQVNVTSKVLGSGRISNPDYPEKEIKQ